MRLALAILISLLLQACVSDPKQLGDQVYLYEGGNVSLFDDHGDCYLSIDGPINKSLEMAFNNALDQIEKMECVEKIALISSHGGDLNVALHIGREIRAHRLSTDIHQFCESACAFLYVGGVRRLVHQNSNISKDSQLGVHQPASELLFRQCIRSKDKDPLLVQKISQYLAQMLPKNAAQELSRAMFDTPCDRISYMDANTLLRSGIATEKVDLH